MIYTVEWKLEPYRSPQFSGHWYVMSRVYDATGQLVYEDSLTGPFKDANDLKTTFADTLAKSPETYRSGDNWRGIRLP